MGLYFRFCRDFYQPLILGDVRGEGREGVGGEGRTILVNFDKNRDFIDFSLVSPSFCAQNTNAFMTVPIWKTRSFQSVI